YFWLQVKECRVVRGSVRDGFAIRFILFEGSLRILSSVISTIKQRLQFGQVRCRKKPRPIVSGRESKRSCGDQLDFMALVLQFLAFRCRTLSQKTRAASADDSRSFFLAATKTKAAGKADIVGIHGGIGEEGVVRIKLF